jgi:TPR repeat protein
MGEEIGWSVPMFKREYWLDLAKRAALACLVVAMTSLAHAAGPTPSPAPAAAAATAPSGPTRRAFVLGVERYSDPQIQRLSRSDADATDVAADLEQLGFDRKNITLATDLRAKVDFDKRFATFLATVQEGDFVYFFFSGHGIGLETADTNYLLFADLKSLFSFTRDKLPDAERRQPEIIPLRMPSFVGAYEAEEIVKNGVSAAEVMQSIARRKPKAAFIVLDACRSLAVQIGDDRSAVRSAESGSRLVPSKDLPPGMMVLYSASFGEQAVESFGRYDTRRNSLFTEVLRSEMPRPGQTLQGLADRVSLVVRHFADSGGRQQDPESFQNLGSADDFTLVGGIGAERYPASSDQCEGSQADWEQISQQPEREALERHRRRFASCATAELARRALVNLVSSSQDPTPAPVASNNQLDDCDRLAAADNDPARPPEAAGVPLYKIDFDAARTACNLSIKRNPRIVRYLFNLGRVEQAAANSMRLDDPARAETSRRAYLALDDAATRGYVAALYYLAIQLNYGSPSEADNDRANKLLQQAAEQGFPLAAYTLGLRYAEGSFGQERDVTRAYDWLARAAESGSVPAMVEVGQALWLARGVSPRNPRRAVEWLQRAAEAGSNNAKFDLGVHYFWGFRMLDENNEPQPSSVLADETQSLLWFGRAAESGDPASQRQLAYLMGEGFGLPNPQPEISERYYRLAARGGDEDAEIDFADRLRLGRVLVKPENGSEEAIDLLQRALSQGSARAARRLALIYRNGDLGEPKAPLKAMAFAYRAIELSTRADPASDDGNPMNEIEAGILLAEMAQNHEAEDVNGNPLLTKDEIDRLEQFYGKVDPVTKKVRIRRLEVPLICNGVTRPTPIWVWDWGRNESPTEPQFRALDRTSCAIDPVLRLTMIASFQTAKKSNVPFADLIQQQIIAAAALNNSRNRQQK